MQTLCLVSVVRSLSRFLAKLSYTLCVTAALFGVSWLSAQTHAGVPDAQPTRRILETVDDSVVVRQPRTVHPYAVAANDRGRVDANLPINRILLLLKPDAQQQAELSKLLMEQHDPASATYQHWLSPEQFAAKFGPDHGDLEQTTSWLLQHGFSVNNAARGGQWIEFSGSAADVESAFHTELHNYVVHGEKHIANSTDISLPRALSPVVSGVVSLNDFRQRRWVSKGFVVQRDTNGKLKPATSSGTEVRAAAPEFTTPDGSAHFLTPGDWSRIYNTKPLLDQGINGSNVSIAVVGSDSDIQLSDVRTFRQIFKLPPSDPLVIVNGADPGVAPFSNAEVEADLDVEWAGAVAPGAQIKFVTSSTTASTSGFQLSIADIVDNRIAPIMSTSIGGCELFLGPAGNAFLAAAYQQASAEGISVIAAAGDTGAAGCEPQISDGPANSFVNWGPMVNGSASTPYDVAVGGTALNENGQDPNFWNTENRPDLSSAVGYIPETVWNESCDPNVDQNFCAADGFPFTFALIAGSGGASSCVDSVLNIDPEANTVDFTCNAGYPKPSWQAGIGVPNDGARDLPDLSLTSAGAHDGYFICVEGLCQTTTDNNGQTVLQQAFVVGGTSAAAPSFAGVTALLEQTTHPFLGLLNFNLYKLAAGEDLGACNSTSFTDPNQQGNCVFYDVTAGDNNVPGQTGFDAVAGFDLATGLGSLNVEQLVSQWDSASKMASKTSLAVNEAGIVQHGQPLNVHVAVKPNHGNGAPSGDFSLLTNNSGSFFGGTLANGAFAGGIATLPGGDYSVRAHYAGDPMFDPSDSEPVRVRIAPEDSQVKVSVWDLGPGGAWVPLEGDLNYGQGAGLQIDVLGKSGVGAPSGSIYILMDGATRLGPYVLNQAGNVFAEVDQVGANGVTPGTHSFVVSYVGDKSFNPSVAAPASFRVFKDGAAQLFVFPVQYPWTAGVPIDVAAVVATFGEPVALPFGKQLPTGNIRIFDCASIDFDGNCVNAVPLGPALKIAEDGPMGLGIPQVLLRHTFTAGDHILKAIYSGDSFYEAIPFTAGTLDRDFPITVAPAAGVSVRLNQQAPGTVGLGQSQNYSVSVRASHSGSPMPTGTVTLFDSLFNQLGDTVQVVNGSASVVVPWYHAGQQLVFASYSGDDNYAAVATPTVTTIVQPAVPVVSVTPAAAVISSRSQTTLTTLVGGGPSNPNIGTPGFEFGQVEYFDSVNGAPAQVLGAGLQLLTIGNGNTSINVLPVTLPQGKNVITVRFLGTPDWAPTSSTPVVVTVNEGRETVVASVHR